MMGTNIQKKIMQIWIKVKKWKGSPILTFTSLLWGGLYHFENNPQKISFLWKSDTTPLDEQERERFANIAEKIGISKEELDKMYLCKHKSWDTIETIGHGKDAVIIFPKILFSSPLSLSSIKNLKRNELERIKEARDKAIERGGPPFYFPDEINFSFGTTAMYVHKNIGGNLILNSGVVTIGTFLAFHFLIRIPFFSSFGTSFQRFFELFWAFGIIQTHINSGKDYKECFKLTVETLGVKSIDAALSGTKADLAYNKAKRKGIAKLFITPSGNNLLHPPPSLTTRIRFLEKIREQQ